MRRRGGLEGGVSVLLLSLDKRGVRRGVWERDGRNWGWGDQLRPGETNWCQEKSIGPEGGESGN